MILNRVFSTGFTKQQRPRGGEDRGPADSWRKTIPGQDSVNVRTQRGKRVWLMIGSS